METLLGLNGMHWALFGGALAAIGGAIGSALGVAYASKTGLGVLTEDPDKFGSVLILAALPGTQGFYGFIVALLVIVFFNLLSTPQVLLTAGLAAFFACLPSAFGLLISGIAQGWTSQSSIMLVGRHGEATGKAVIFPALVETYAVTSLVVTVFFLLVARAAV